jgi:rubrerythrin
MVSGGNLVSEDVVAKILECSIQLELQTAKLYSVLATKSSGLTSLVFNHISGESRNHASTLANIRKALNIAPVKVDCSEFLGATYRVTVELIELAGKVNDIREMFDKLRAIENGLGEETYHITLLPLIRDPYPEESSVIDKLIEEIVLEEKYHKELLDVLYEECVNKR